MTLVRLRLCIGLQLTLPTPSIDIQGDIATYRHRPAVVRHMPNGSPESCALGSVYLPPMQIVLVNFCLIVIRSWAGTTLAEVDSVLATTEVQQLLDEEGLSLALLPESGRDMTAAGMPADDEQDSGVYGYPGGAGGYLEFIYRCWPCFSPGWLPCSRR